MKEIGEITQVKDTQATVKIKRNSSCGSCNACSMGQNEDEMFITVSNDLGANPGDWVELDLESLSVLKASAIVYLIPLFALILGVAAGYALARYVSGNAELYGALGGLLLMVISFFIIRAMEPALNEKGEYTPKMVSIVDR
ncbi:MAG TPA: SoxR reducing system RseC family protein [Clostridia bacterium]|nr:SoxR reducing system RseC family protein [Clostridia bacterium]